MPNTLKTLLVPINQLVRVLFFISFVSACVSKKEEIHKNEEIQEQDTTLAHIEFFHTEHNFTLVLNLDSINRVLAFRKHPDSTQFRFLNYQNSIGGMTELREELKYIDVLWKIAEDSIAINLNGAMVGYPMEYKDVLRNHVNAVLKESFHYIDDYKGLREIMYVNNVYKPLDSLFLTRGLVINSISTEKHGKVPKQELLELGFSDTLTIPVPFMVWLNIKKASE